ncbi:MAG: hypothetical protein WCK09_00250 [Bacteroidota bacterium]
MFDLKSFEVCPQTGITSFEMTWDLGHGVKSDRGSFVDRTDAEKYVLSSKRSYILLMFSKFVVHSRVLFETGHHDFYRKESKLASLDRCIKYNSWLQDKKLEEICKVILALEEDLHKILPSPANPSHSSSESKIIDMILFCKKELQNYPKNQNHQLTREK